MPTLYPENYVAPPAPEKLDIKTMEISGMTVKDYIKSVVDKPTRYKDICEHVQKKLHTRNIHFPDREVIAVIREVDAEWHPEETVEP